MYARAYTSIVLKVFQVFHPSDLAVAALAVASAAGVQPFSSIPNRYPARQASSVSKL